jgi:hypothetical protein
LYGCFAGTITFLSVTAAWVFFRASSLDSALTMLRSMAGLNGIDLPRATVRLLSGQESEWLRFDGAFASGILNYHCLPWIGLVGLIVWAMPNTLSWLGYSDCPESIFQSNNHKPLKSRSLGFWKVVLAGSLFFLGLKPLFDDRSTEFLYFNF